MGVNCPQIASWYRTTLDKTTRGMTEHFLLCPRLRPTNHMHDQRLRAAYGHGETGMALRRSWAASLVWKLNHVVTR